MNSYVYLSVMLNLFTDSHSVPTGVFPDSSKSVYSNFYRPNTSHWSSRHAFVSLDDLFVLSCQVTSFFRE